MAKRWTVREDMFIHAYLGAVSADLMARKDLARSATSITKRAAFLRETGAWAALDRMLEAQKEYCRAIGMDDFHTDMATIRR